MKAPRPLQKKKEKGRSLGGRVILLLVGYCFLSWLPSRQRLSIGLWHRKVEAGVNPQSSAMKGLEATDEVLRHLVVEGLRFKIGSKGIVRCLLFH